MERSRWWREKEFVILLVVVASICFIRLDALTIRGEEATRWHVGAEMVEDGDWFTPHVQGELFVSRPPLQNWIIAGSCWLFDSQSPFTLRLHSALATLFVCVLLYGYCRTFLSRAGALTAALAFVTMGEMFTNGRLAETEAVYIAFLSGALIVWHWGYLSGTAPAAYWMAGYSLIALAGLCKGGLQPPVYFLGGIGAYLFLTKNLRAFFRPAHLAGIAVWLIIVGAWMIPNALRNGWEIAKITWMNDTSARFEHWKLGEFLIHLASFPAEAVGCTCPWILVLLAYMRKDVRAAIGNRAPAVLLMGLTAGAAFLTCWFPPHGATRYFAPLYPCLAVLIGTVIDTIAVAPAGSTVRALWSRIVQGMLTAMAIAAGLIVVSAALALPAVQSIATSRAFLVTPLPVALVYLAAIGLLMGVVWRCRIGAGSAPIVRGVVAASLFLGVFILGFLFDIRMRRSEDIPASIVRLKDQLPADAKLVSLNRIDLSFVYYYGQRVPLLPLERALEVPSGSYFCYQSDLTRFETLPFEWREVGRVSTERNHHDTPKKVIVVAVRLPEKAVGTVRNDQGR